MIEFVTCWIIIFIPVFLFGQESYTEIKNPQAEILKLVEASKNTQAISCDFIQKKELSILSEIITSEGVFLLKGNDKLVWEYRQPYFYKVIINGNQMEIDDSESKMNFDTRSNRMFREISNIMIKSVNGSIISDNETFETEILENTTELLVKMKPKTKELGMLFQYINLHFSKENYLVEKIEMFEELGDKTTILFNNQKLNVPIEDSLFDIR